MLDWCMLCDTVPSLDLHSNMWLSRQRLYSDTWFCTLLKPDRHNTWLEGWDMGIRMCSKEDHHKDP